jgi:uncharacterized protein
MSNEVNQFSAVVQRVVTDDARAARFQFPFSDARQNLIVFCEVLRVKHEFKIGPGEITDALRALEAVGLEDVQKVQAALRLVCCARLEDVEVFDWAFREFFFPAPQGVAQEHQPPMDDQKPKRPSDEKSDDGNQKSNQPVKAESGEEDEEELEGSGQKRVPVEDDPRAEFQERIMRAQYSAMAGDVALLEIPRDGLEAMLRAAGEVVTRLRLGRSRKWRMQARGSRFDFRRTMRSSLSTGGDTLHPKWLGHPRRNPRFVLLLDGSRSMLEHTAPMVQFAFALAQRSRRVDVFTFSTELRDVTRDFKHLAQQRKLEVRDLSRAWGGGTRIGENFRVFLRDHAHRVLSPETLVLVSSDGLDVGEVEVLEAALREIKRRSAGIVWLNPLLAFDGYTPTARGMKAAMPFLTHFTHANTPQMLARLADDVRLSQ